MRSEDLSPTPSPNEITFLKTHLHLIEEPSDRIGFMEMKLFFLLALRDVVEATVGMFELAERTERNRESLYKTLSATGNPRWSSVRSILDGLGYRLAIAPIHSPQS